MYTYGDRSMLIKFSVENYKSFNNKVSLDLTKPHDYSFNKSAIKNGIIKNAVIFGDNGCGKSNFSFALFDIVPTLTDRQFDQLQVDPTNFLNYSSEKKYATFSYEFLFDNKNIKYIYRKSTPTNIIFEEMSVDDEIIYQCDIKNKKFNDFSLYKLGYVSFNSDGYKWDIPFLRYLKSNTSHDMNSPISFIMEFANKMLWFRSLQTNGYIGIKNGSELLSPWIIENNLVGEFQDFLFDVAGLKFNLGVISNNNPINQKILVMYNEDKTRGLNFDVVSSSGTKSLQLLFYWYKQLKDVSFVFIDEFDAFYHFELAKSIINLFKSLTDIQTLFTSHNTYIANNDILRPDCYFTLDKGTIKSFVERTSRELREGHSLEKLLRSGEFNAK